MATCCTVKVRLESPESHTSVHAVHSSHAPTQSTGQFKAVLHDWLSLAPAVATHATPPSAAATDTANWRSVVPSEPHVAEQSLH
jgi:hypothetical protein